MKNRILEEDLFAKNDPRIEKVKKKILETIRKDKEEKGIISLESDEDFEAWKYNILTVEHLCGHFTSFFAFILNHGFMK